jgi:hypothetical protein
MQIADLLTPENVTKFADEIVTTFAIEANERSLEIDFKLNAGVMEVNWPNSDMKIALEQLHGKEMPLPNTSFSFNTQDGSLLNAIKREFCHLVENSLIQDQDHDLMAAFIRNVIKEINTNPLLMKRIKDTIRKINKAPEDIFPFSDAAVVLFEFGEKEDYGDMIKVANYSRYNKQLQSFVGEKEL